MASGQFHKELYLFSKNWESYISQALCKKLGTESLLPLWILLTTRERQTINTSIIK